ncbi:hypothetical protein ACWOBH_06160 [Globicatella sanguinis]
MEKITCFSDLKYYYVVVFESVKATLSDYQVTFNEMELAKIINDVVFQFADKEFEMKDLKIAALKRALEKLNKKEGIEMLKLGDRINKYISEMDEEIRNRLYDVYEESDGTLWFVESGMAYSGDDKSAKEVAQVENGEVINLY